MTYDKEKNYTSNWREQFSVDRNFRSTGSKTVKKSIFSENEIEKTLQSAHGYRYAKYVVIAFILCAIVAIIIGSLAATGHLNHP